MIKNNVWQHIADVVREHAGGAWETRQGALKSTKNIKRICKKSLLFSISMRKKPKETGQTRPDNDA